MHKPNAELERPTRTGLFFFSLLLLALGFKGNLEVGDIACMILYSTCTSTQEVFGSFLLFVVFFCLGKSMYIYIRYVKTI